MTPDSESVKYAPVPMAAKAMAPTSRARSPAKIEMRLRMSELPFLYDADWES